MVRFNSSKKAGKPKKTIRKLAQPASVKPNKPKMVFEKCFLRGRYLIATSFIFLGLGALVARAAYVQSVNSEILSGEADKRSLRKDDVLSVRGSILDRNGQLLSVSVPMSAIVAEPRLMLKENALDDKERIKALANELNMTPAELVKKIEKNAKSGFLYLARQVEARDVYKRQIQAIPKGQWESGAALGLSRAYTFINLIMPQVWRHALPGLSNQWLVLLKDTALVSLIGVDDLMRQAGYINTNTHEPFTWYGIAALIYLVITLISQAGIRKLELRFTRFERGVE